MTESLFVVILGLLAIAAATVVAPRVGIASPLLLVVVGIGVSFLPFVPDVELEPHWILTVVLPPLLYSAAVSMPPMEFRREFSAIRGLSVVLVAISAVLLGLFFWAVIPGLSLAWGSRSARSSARPTRSRHRSSNASGCPGASRPCSRARDCSTTRPRS